MVISAFLAKYPEPSKVKVKHQLLKPCLPNFYFGLICFEIVQGIASGTVPYEEAMNARKELVFDKYGNFIK